MRMELIIRFDYGDVVPWVRKCGDGLEAIAGPNALVLRTPIETRGEDLTTAAEFEIAEGERAPFVLTWYPSHEKPPRAIQPEHALRFKASFEGAHGVRMGVGFLGALFGGAIMKEHQRTDDFIALLRRVVERQLEFVSIRKEPHR